MGRYVIDLMQSNNKKKLNLVYLTDIDKFFVNDLKDYATAINVSEIRDNQPCVYDNPHETTLLMLVLDQYENLIRFELDTNAAKKMTNGLLRKEDILILDYLYSMVQMVDNNDAYGELDFDKKHSQCDLCRDLIIRISKFIEENVK